MKLIKKHDNYIIILTIIVALLLSELPLPAAIAPYQPEWVILVLIYWSMALPERIGVGSAWFTGLLLDVLRDTLLGQYALAFALTVFITSKLYQRIRNFPLQQQVITIFILMLIHLSLVIWIKALSGINVDFSMALIPSLISALFWPVVYIILRSVRRTYHLT